jgi:hypothetical protein
MDKDAALWGMIKRKERWTLTLRAWLLMLLLAVLLVTGFVLGAHPFLAVSQPLDAEFLAVEGWLPDYALEVAAKEFMAHPDRPYKKLLVIGGALERGSFLAAYETYGKLGAATLTKLGISTNAIEAIPSLPNSRDRTYFSSLALSQWFQAHGLSAKSINVVSMGPHARRTRLLFAKAMGSGVSVGIIAVDDRDYDPHHWWRTSAGVRSLVDEMVAYCYARFLFHPAH